MTDNISCSSSTIYPNDFVKLKFKYTRTDDDEQRISYVKTALEGLQRCIDDGLDIRGYYYWSFLDNFEWLYGYKPRFGLIEVDRETLARKSKKSLKFYQEIIEKSS